jgi:hypothetical protein
LEVGHECAFVGPDRGRRVGLHGGRLSPACSLNHGSAREPLARHQIESQVPFVVSQRADMGVRIEVLGTPVQSEGQCLGVDLGDVKGIVGDGPVEDLLDLGARARTTWTCSPRCITPGR